MALTTGTALALAAAAGGAGLNYANTTRTANRQDRELAGTIRKQGENQRKADAKVNEQVDKLEGSRSADEKAKRMAEYFTTLTRGRKNIEAGLDGAAGGAAFQDAAAGARKDVADYAGESAGLMAGIDAAGLQRMGEGFDFGRLGTDLDLVRRQSQGEQFLSDLRLRGIRRNPWMDAGSSLLSGLSGAMAGGAGAGAGAAAGGGYTSNGALLAGILQGSGAGLYGGAPAIKLPGAR